MGRPLRLQAYVNRYDLSEVHVVNGTITGAYKDSDAKPKFAHINDVRIVLTESGCRAVYEKDRHIYTFGPRQ
jgi:hypothetical protein